MIQSEAITGLYAFNQWFEVKQGSLEVEVYELMVDVNDKRSICYLMGASYPEKDPNIISSPILPKRIHECNATGSIAITFIDAKSGNRISFSLVEVKAFIEEG